MSSSQIRNPFSQPLSLKRQKGVVIVIALFFVALVVTIAYIMIARLDRDVRRTTLILRNTQAELYAQGSIAWALDTLHNNFLKQKNDKPVDSLPLKSPVNKIGGYLIKSTLYDMQDRFNINTIINPDANRDFYKLIKLALPELSSEELQRIVESVTEWIKPDKDENTSLSRYYLGLPEAYRSAHRAMNSISELRMVKGITPEIYNVLKAYLTALPENESAINVQTANITVLASLSPEMTLEGAKIIADLRAKKPITSTDTIINLDKLSQFKIPKEKITATSSYFLIKTEVGIDDQHIFLYTLVARVLKNANVSMRVIWQSKHVSG